MNEVEVYQKSVDRYAVAPAAVQQVHGATQVVKAAVDGLVEIVDHVYDATDRHPELRSAFLRWELAYIDGCESVIRRRLGGPSW